MKSLLPLRVGGAWVAIEARAVVEILGPAAITKIPGTPRVVLGVAAFRGRAIAVVDVGVLLGEEAPISQGEPRARTVVAMVGASTVALPADAVREVIEVAERDLSPPLEGEPWSEARAQIEGALVPVIDLGRAAPVIAPG